MSRRSIRVIAVAAAVCIVAGGVWLATLSDADHYRLTQSNTALERVLSEHVVNGMSVDELEQLLGPARRDVNQAQQRAAVRQFMGWSPEDFPDGVEEGDEWIAYPTDADMVVNLQTRKGRLVNFKPQAFAQPMAGLQ